MKERFTYSPYGVSGDDNAGFSFRFTGQKLHPEPGLCCYKARYYDPQFGRFLQVDPIGCRNQQNLYAYVGNDPVNWIDPLGLCRIEDEKIIECDVNIDDDLDTSERVVVDELIKRGVEVGEKIQESDDDQLKEAWENITELNFTNDLDKCEYACNEDQTNITFGREGISAEPADIEDVENFQYEAVVHEIEHGTHRSQDRGEG